MLLLTHVCAGLLQGLPDGTEEDKLWSFEEDMERNSVLLRQYKSNNEQVDAVGVLTQQCQHDMRSAQVSGHQSVHRLLTSVLTQPVLKGYLLLR